MHECAIKKSFCKCFFISSRLQLSAFATSPHETSNWWQSPQFSAFNQSLQTPHCSLSSQAASCSSSCWDSSLQTSQTEPHYQSSHIYSHRKRSEPPAYQPSESLPFTQQEVDETAVSFSQRGRCTIHPSLFEQTAQWGE